MATIVHEIYIYEAMDTYKIIYNNLYRIRMLVKSIVKVNNVQSPCDHVAAKKTWLGSIGQSLQQDMIPVEKT